MAFFFFQAEDGIRDDLVTGVQTCALPISAELVQLELQLDKLGGKGGSAQTATSSLGALEIGRASCRERGVDLGGRRIIKKKRGRDLWTTVICDGRTTT